MDANKKLLRRRDKFIESLKELGYPFVLAYGNTFDFQREVLQAYTHGAGRKINDIDALLTILGQSACRNLGMTQRPMTEFTDSGTIRTGEPVEPAPACVLETPCSS